MGSKQSRLTDWDGKQKTFKHFEQEDQLDPDDDDCSYEAVYRRMRVE